MSRTDSQPPLTWPARVLQLAGCTNLACAALLLIPAEWMPWSRAWAALMPQSFAWIIGLFGITYLAAARDVARYWPVAAIGLLCKLLAPVWYLCAVAEDGLSWPWAMFILLHDLLWWWPLAAVVYHSLRQASLPARRVDRFWSLEEAIWTARSHRGATMGELSQVNRLLVVFLRHGGCTFCREALADLAAQRRRIEASGVQLALVFMSCPLEAYQVSATYGLDDVHRFSDRDCSLYRVFGLDRGGLRELFGWKVWWRGLRASVLDGHGVGWPAGDAFQMPGVFLLDRGDLVDSYRAKSIADRPDYIALSRAAPAPAAHRRAGLASRCLARAV